MLPKIYKSEESLKNEIERIDNKINLENDDQGLSGHAFVCFDSVLSAETILINCQ